MELGKAFGFVVAWVGDVHITSALVRQVWFDSATCAVAQIADDDRLSFREGEGIGVEELLEMACDVICSKGAVLVHDDIFVCGGEWFSIDEAALVRGASAIRDCIIVALPCLDFVAFREA